MWFECISVFFFSNALCPLFVALFSIFFFTSAIMKQPFYFDLTILPSSTVGHRLLFVSSFFSVYFLFEIAVNTPHNYVDKNSMQNCNCFFFLYVCIKAVSLQTIVVIVAVLLVVCVCVYFFLFFITAGNQLALIPCQNEVNYGNCLVASVKPFFSWNDISEWEIAEIQIT